MSMADDRLSLPNETDLQSGALLPVNALPHSNGEWNGVVVKEPSAELAKPDLAIYLHAIRRHWLMALGIGLLCAAIAGPAVYIGMGEQYTAYSLLRVSMQENSLISHDVNTVDRDRFEIYKGFQQDMLLSRAVLTSAIRKPEVIDIPIIQRLTQYGDPVEWLTGKLAVSFPLKAEAMTVSLTLDNPKEAQALVKAVVESYMNEVVNAETTRKQKRYNDLVTICDAKEQEIRAKREELKSLVAGIGSTDSPELLGIRQRALFEELGLYRSEVARNSADISHVKNELSSQHALLENVDKADVPAIELDQLVQNDPQARQLQIELGMKKMEHVYTQGAMKKGANTPYASRYGEEVEMLQKEYDERLKEMEMKARQKKRNLIDTEIVRLQALLTPMEEQQVAATKKIAKLMSDAEKISVTSVDIQMTQAELRNMDIVVANFANEREKLAVEIHSTPRIAVLEPAEEPLVPSNTMLRLASTCLAIIASLCFPAAAVVLWDSRTRRINTAADVSQGLRLPVIGSMPLVPARVIRQLGSPSPRHRVWHLRLTESVDGIAARLLRKADMEQCRVIMVSSATGGEGKTTLATQLALSLARTGRRIVLVDFDLRRPSFDEMFGLPLSPGVSESLRHENDVADLVHQSATDNLAVVTAGRWDRQALASLSNGSVSNLFKQLREDYDFVVVDTSPILPVADARFVSQFVDTVVLSVFRDVSEAPKIQAACDILAAFGAHSVEAVVTGSNNNLYGRHTGYESTVSA